MILLIDKPLSVLKKQKFTNKNRYANVSFKVSLGTTYDCCVKLCFNKFENLNEMKI